MGKLLPIILAVVGIGAGIGAGIATRPEPTPTEEAKADAEVEKQPDTADVGEPEESADHDYVAMSNQFVIPLVKDGSVRALVVLSLTLEVPTGSTEAVFEREPKLRDAFLQVMFDHANVGGFDGFFTDSGQLSPLRQALAETANVIMGPIVSDVLVTDLIRQEV